ncbi:hypothetical protein BN8_02771 [Fibrisoma limi BUZ 3]|uniref:Uncharacterized protein n=1 Tax=Fibrisoma limi BUZ 3 TaxID=1185876 RepID=I2GID3_9BACT|nr:hypothetical protein BN8_02771 [Fibrisoma limi BUZ 3]
MYKMRTGCQFIQLTAGSLVSYGKKMSLTTSIRPLVGG